MKQKFQSCMRGGDRAYIYVYILLIALYVFGVVYHSSPFFMSGDDFTFYHTLLQGKPIWHGITLDYGRFFPLAGWNLNLIAHFSTSPYAFMVGNACIFICTAYIFWHIARIYDIKPKFIVLGFLIFILSPGYTHIITSISYPELSEILFLLLFILSCHYFYQTRRLLWFCLGFIFANGCIYLKEVGFVLVSGFCFLHLFIVLYCASWNLKNIDRKILFFDGFIVLSGCIYLVLYMLLASKAQQSYIELLNFSILRNSIIALFGVPLVSIALPCALCFRAYRIYKHKDRPDSVLDTLGVVALVYFLAYLCLGMAAFHYFAPSLILACLYLGFFANIYAKFFSQIFAKTAIIVNIFILLTAAIPQGMNAFSTYKTQNKNTYDAFAFLAEYIRHSSKKVDIYFEGFCRGSDRCEVDSFMVDTLFAILPSYFNVTQGYDFKSKEPNGNNMRINSASPFSFRNSTEVSKPQSGDIVILHYLHSKFMKPSDIDRILSRYELLYKTNNYPYFPTYNLLSLSAWFLQQMDIKTPLSNKGNIFKLPSQVYILRVP